MRISFGPFMEVAPSAKPGDFGSCSKASWEMRVSKEGALVWNIFLDWEHMGRESWTKVLCFSLFWFRYSLITFNGQSDLADDNRKSFGGCRQRMTKLHSCTPFQFEWGSRWVGLRWGKMSCVHQVVSQRPLGTNKLFRTLPNNGGTWSMLPR